MLLLLFSSIPYLFYGISASSGRIVGSIARNITEINVSSYGRLFVYIKDFFAIILFLRLFGSLRKKDAAMLILFFMYGFFVLFINGRWDPKYIVAGIRTFIFFIDAILYFRKYDLEPNEIKILKNNLVMIIGINMILVLRSIINSGNLFATGAGAYRYSGAFAGAGNLACYCMVTSLLMYILYKKYKIISGIQLLVLNCCMLFLSFASGTRTAIIVTGILILYIISELVSKITRFGETLSAFIFVLMCVLFGTSFLDLLVTHINRGQLSVSGLGRLEIFLDFFSGNVFEIIFGRGLGYGTNASVNLGIIDTAISDSTIALIFAQFGFVGLVLFIFMSFYFIHSMFVSKWTDRITNCMVMFIYIVLLFIGNLFEQNAMIMIFVISVFLNKFDPMEYERGGIS